MPQKDPNYSLHESVPVHRRRSATDDKTRGAARRGLKIIGKGFVLFEINSSPSAFYIIKPTCIVIGF